MTEEEQAKLVATVEQLQQQVAELRELVVAERHRKYRSMRDSQRCPACGGGRLVHVKRSRAISHGGDIQDAALAHESSWTITKARGPLESFSCVGCGLVEYHVIDFKDVRADGTNIVEIVAEDPPASAGPFR